MGTYTKEHRYLNAFDISVMLNQVESSLDMVISSFSDNVDNLKIYMEKLGIEADVTADLVQNFECLNLISNTIYNLREECNALRDRR